MSVIAWLALALPFVGMILALALCVAAARGDDILRQSNDDLDRDPFDDEDAVVVDFPAHRTRSRGECRNGIGRVTR